MPNAEKLLSDESDCGKYGLIAHILCCPSTPQNPVCFSLQSSWEKFKERIISEQIGTLVEIMLKKFQEYYDVKNIEEAYMEEQKTQEDCSADFKEDQSVEDFLSDDTPE